MTSVDPLFHQLDEVFNNILAGMKAPARQASARAIGTALRRSQQQRIARQQNPDGSAYAKRRRRVLRSQAGISFIWQGEARSLKTWRVHPGRRGKMVTGFDEDRGAVRSFYKKDIERYLDIKFSEVRKDTTKSAPMFRRLRTARFMKVKAGADGVDVGYSGVAAKIARAHQFGLRDKVAGQSYTTYPPRVLIGLTTAERLMIAEKMIDSMRLA